MRQSIDFGGYLKMLRKRKNVTVRQLGEDSGVSHSYLTLIENGKRGIPSPEVLKKIASALDVEYVELMLQAGYLDQDSSYQPPIYEFSNTDISKDNELALLVLGQNLRLLRENNKLSLEDVAKKLGVSVEQYKLIEKGELEVTHTFIEDAAINYEINPHVLFAINKSSFHENSSIDYKDLSGNYDANFRESNKTLEKREIEIVEIPIYGTIKAGYDRVADEDIVGYKVTAKRDVADGDYFYLIVKGDSMIDEGIRDGYHVLVKKQTHVDNGKIGVIIVNGDEATLKRVYYEGENVILQAANRNVPPRILPIKDVLIQGQVKSVVFDV